MKSSLDALQLILASGMGGKSTKLNVTLALSHTEVLGAGKHTSYSKVTLPINPLVGI